MRRGALVIGVVLVLAITGCGGSSAPRALGPQSLPEFRALIRPSVDSKLEKLERPAKEIACVNRNIAAMGVRQVADRLVEAAPVGGAKSAAAVVGPLGRGCP